MNFLVLRHDRDIVPTAIREIVGEYGPVVVFYPGHVDAQEFEDNLSTLIGKEPNLPITLMINVPTLEVLRTWSRVLPEILDSQVVCGQKLPRNSSIILVSDATNNDLCEIDPRLHSRIDVVLDIKSNVEKYCKEGSGEINPDESEIIIRHEIGHLAMAIRSDRSAIPVNPFENVRSNKEELGPNL